MKKDETLTLSVHEAAVVLGIGDYAVRAAIRRGEIPALRFGKLIRVSKAWVRSKTSAPELALASDASAVPERTRRRVA